MFGELVSSGGGFSLVSRTFVVPRLAWADAWWARLVCGVSLCEPVASTTDAGNITVGVPRWLLLFPSVSLPRPQPHKKIRAHPAWSVVFSRPSLVSACSCRHRAFQPCCYTTCIWWPTDRIARIILQLKAPVVSLAVSWAAGRDVPWPRRCKFSSTFFDDEERTSNSDLTPLKKIIFDSLSWYIASTVLVWSSTWYTYVLHYFY